MWQSCPGTTRREFVTGLAAGAMASSRSPLLRAADAHPPLAQVLAATLAVDMHSHVGIPFGQPDPPLAHFDLAGEMKRAGFAAVVQTYEVDSVPASGSEDYTHNRQALDYEDRLLAAAHVRRALSLGDLREAHASGQCAIVQSAEGAQFLQGRIERLEEVHRRGLRNLQLVHERDDQVKPLSDLYSRAARFGGLTAFGAEVIRACNQLGIMVDLTHMSFEAVAAALKISTRPMIYSHTSLQPEPGDKAPAPMLVPRLLSRAQARAIAATGSVIGVWNHGSDTAREYVTMIRKLVEVVGVEHVGIGTDTDLEPEVRRQYTNGIWKRERRGFFPAVAAEMLRAGFSADEIAQIGGGNFCRVFGEVTGA